MGLNTTKSITSNELGLGECLQKYHGVANAKEFDWILLLRAKLNYPRFPSDLKLSSSAEELMHGSCLSQDHLLSCLILSSVLTENGVHQGLNVEN